MSESSLVPSIIGLTSMIFHESLSDETDSSDEEIILSSTLKKEKPIRIANYVETVVPSYTRTQFQQHFRINVDAYENLLELIGPQLKRSGTIGRETISIEKQILSVLWLLATPDSYRSVGERFDLAKSSLSVSFVRVVKVLNHFASKIITWPKGERLNLVAEEFKRLGHIENIIGVVDGTFVPIKAPHTDCNSYITRKCNYAITLQAISDSRLKFTDIFVGYPGSVSDTRVFRNSPIYHKIVNNIHGFFPNQQFIIGDKAYPTLPWCLSLYVNRGNLTPAQIFFNTKMSQTRQVIERTFALLFGRFRRLKYVDMNKTEFIPAMVLACCVLHNVCLNTEDNLLEQYIHEGRQNVLNDNEEVVNNGNHIEGRNRRDTICQMLYRNRHNL